MFASTPLPAPSAPAAPAPFVPVFESNCGVVGFGYFTPINPTYCLSPESAEALAEILKDLAPTIYLESPLGPYWGGGFSQVGLVPWFSFTNGVKVNAGQMAQYWAHGYNPAYAERQCRADLAARFREVESGK